MSCEEVNGAFDPLEFSDDFDIGGFVGEVIRILRLTGVATKALAFAGQAIKNVFIPGAVVFVKDVDGEAEKTENITGSILDVEDVKRYDRDDVCP
jgi:hypothetical protein